MFAFSMFLTTLLLAFRFSSHHPGASRAAWRFSSTMRSPLPRSASNRASRALFKRSTSLGAIRPCHPSCIRAAARTPLLLLNHRFLQPIVPFHLHLHLVRRLALLLSASWRLLIRSVYSPRCAAPPNGSRLASPSASPSCPPPYSATASARAAALCCSMRTAGSARPPPSPLILLEHLLPLRLHLLLRELPPLAQPVRHSLVTDTVRPSGRSHAPNVALCRLPPPSPPLLLFCSRAFHSGARARRSSPSSLLG